MIKLFFLFFFIIFTQPLQMLAEDSNQKINWILFDVYGKQFSFSEFYEDYKNYKKSYSSLGENSFDYSLENYKNDWLDSQIIDILFEEYDLEFNENEFNQTVENQRQEIIFNARKENFPVEEKKIDSYLKSKGLPPFLFFKKTLKSLYKKQSLLRYLINSKAILVPSDKDLEEFYMKNKEQFKQENQIQIAHIVLNINEEESKNYRIIKQKEELFQKIYKKLKKEPELFSEYSKKYSDDIYTKYKGGIMGWFDEKKLAKVSPEYLIAFNLKKNEISNIIWTDKGIHMIQNLDFQEEKILSFEEAKIYVSESLILQRAELLLKKLITQNKDYTYNIKQYE